MAFRICRRDLITGLGGAALAWPLAARAQTPTVGYLNPGTPATYAPYLAAFGQGLEEGGFKLWPLNLCRPASV
jgi:putative tryptophan/tyrosine transport system substrate-binding protein